MAEDKGFRGEVYGNYRTDKTDEVDNVYWHESMELVNSDLYTGHANSPIL
jgi:hypothetical protein